MNTFTLFAATPELNPGVDYRGKTQVWGTVVREIEIAFAPLRVLRHYGNFRGTSDLNHFRL